MGPLYAKLTLFAEYFLLFVTLPHTSLHSIFLEFQRFSKVSIFNVNYTNLELLNISLSQSDMKQLSTTFPLKTCSSSIHYLGIRILTEVSQLLFLNILPLLHKTQVNLASYSSKRHLWLGRINTLKMDVLLCFLYWFQMIPIHLPASYFQKCHCMFYKFIWNSAGPRIRFVIFSLPKYQCGERVPDASFYHIAAVFT